MEIGPLRRLDRSPVARPFAPRGPESPGHRAVALPHWLWESTRGAGAEERIACSATPAAIFPAMPLVRRSRCPRSSPDPRPAHRGLRGSADTLRQAHLLGRSCPTDYRSDRPVLPWLSPAMRSAASEPFLARFLDSRQ